MTVPSVKKLLLASGNRVLRPQDVFATRVYTGNGTTQTVTTGLNMARDGGLIWTKNRNAPTDQNPYHQLRDTVRGLNKNLASNVTNGEVDYTGFGPQNPTATGFTMAGNSVISNASSNNFVTWNFRRAKKFFDVITWTGDGASSRQVSHALGIAPGMIVVKSRSTDGNWLCYHRGLGADTFMLLNDSGNRQTSNGFWSNLTSTSFGFNSTVINASGQTYVAYVFAQNAELIDCGAYTGNGATTGPSVTCGKGWTPQFLLVKNASTVTPWLLLDSARDGVNPVTVNLTPNTAQAEGNDTFNGFNFTATGIQPAADNPT